MDFWPAVWGFLDVVSRIVSALLLIAGFVGWVARQAIGEWIKARFIRDLNEQAQRLGHQLETELEAHKASLLRDAEQFKVGIDLQRSVALQVAAAKIEAIRQLVSALGEAGREVLLFPCIPRKDRAAKASACQNAIEAARRITQENEVFFPQDLVRNITALLRRHYGLLREYLNVDTVLSIEDPQIQEWLEEGAKVVLGLKQELANAGKLG